MEIEEISSEEIEYFKTTLFREEMFLAQPFLIEKISKNFLCNVQKINAFKRKLNMSLQYLGLLTWPANYFPDILFDDVISKFRSTLQFIERHNIRG